MTRTRLEAPPPLEAPRGGGCVLTQKRCRSASVLTCWTLGWCPPHVQGGVLQITVLEGVQNSGQTKSSDASSASRAEGEPAGERPGARRTSSAPARRGRSPGGRGCPARTPCLRAGGGPGDGALLADCWAQQAPGGTAGGLAGCRSSGSLQAEETGANAWVKPRPLCSRRFSCVCVCVTHTFSCLASSMWLS